MYRRDALMRPRFMQVANFYNGYLRDFYRVRPELVEATYDDQLSALLKDGFTAAHLHVENLREMGFDTRLVIANCAALQASWVRENNLKPQARMSARQFAARQIEMFRPDVLYTLDAVTFDAKFISELDHRPKVIVGWCGFPVPKETDWSNFDLILSSFDPILAEARERGAGEALRFYPGFPEEYRMEHAPEPEWDVVFSGQLTEKHESRLRSLHALIEWAGRAPERSSRLGLLVPDYPSTLEWPNQGAKWGKEMLRYLRRGRIVVNIDVDAFNAQPPNMRLIESTGVGAFVLTSYHVELGRFFEPRREVETFRSIEEMIEKIDHYLANPREREAIARRGRERCLAQHGLRDRSRWLAGLLMERL